MTIINSVKPWLDLLKEYGPICITVGTMVYKLGRSLISWHRANTKHRDLMARQLDRCHEEARSLRQQLRRHVSGG